MNVKYARGTLVYDEVDKRLSVQIVRSMDEIRIQDSSNYWAAGGISMQLQRKKEDWYAQAKAEALPFMDEQRERSAVVYDRQGRLYLVVTPTRVTAGLFRQGIMEYFSSRHVSEALEDGIFLDGDGSAQLYVRQSNLKGDGRSVHVMLRLK
ncbi:phosphodiester glycosidase family protein [Paenibacillus sp. 481]|uniref:phosphodiester glycosidase family protein n=1 Tax=Paenibacillus sp. 481 TaxID=2835869 RepID=UPI001E574BDE|nr:phosphodiester glycosidase family protein [Paenibacillus sp. 481]UHA73842.1 phosphodiester glycosidase family protein [Paenibacillus sp. 481]